MISKNRATTLIHLSPNNLFSFNSKKIYKQTNTLQATMSLRRLSPLHLILWTLVLGVIIFNLYVLTSTHEDIKKVKGPTYHTSDTTKIQSHISNYDSRRNMLID